MQQKLERSLEIAVVLAALATIPLTIELERGTDTAVFTAVDWLVWGTFLTEYVVLLSLAGDRRKYIRHHWFNAAIVILSFPMLTTSGTAYGGPSS